MTDRDEQEKQATGRRRVLRWLTAAPVALAWPRALTGCSSSKTEVDGGPGGRDAANRKDGGRDGGARDGGGPADAGPAADAGDTCEATTSDALGPFYEEGAPMRTQLADGEPGEPLRIEGRLVSARDCRTALGGYGLDLWQANRDGEYYEPPDYRLRGRLVTGDDGSFAFETIKPGNYPLGDGFRPAHIHVLVYGPSGTELLQTQLYFEGDPYIGDDDACQPPNCFSNDPDRIIRLTTTMIGGKEGKLGMVPLRVEPERG